MTELGKFVELARKSHSFIQEYLNSGIQAGAGGNCLLMIWRNLKQLKTTDVHSTQRLLEKIESSRRKHENILENLKHAKDEIEAENESATALITRKAMKKQRAATTLLICGTLAGAMVGHPHIGAVAGMVASRRVSKACGSRKKTEQQRHESALEAHYSMERETVVAITELCSLEFLIHKVVNEINSLLRSVEDGINNIGDVDFAIKTTKNKMDTFAKQIDKLDTEACTFGSVLAPLLCK